jgi:RNA polymerase sigma-70 factor (ECF subfamily)
MDDSDLAAVARAQAGDSDGFRALVERHSRSVFRLAYRMTGNEQDAEDVVQETFLRAFRQLDRFEARCAFASWVYRIGANCALDLMRARKRAHEQPGAADPEADAMAALPSHSPGPDRMAFSGQMRRRIELALNLLTEQERAAFVLRHHEGLSSEELGEALGIGPGAAKHTVFRAVQKLRRALEPLVGVMP